MNVDMIDEFSMDMEVETIMSADKVNEGQYILSEIEQVLLVIFVIYLIFGKIKTFKYSCAWRIFQMMEDMMKDLRNTTKDVEIRETNLFEMIPMYRAKYAQPAFDQAKMLKEHGQYLEK